MQRISIVWLMLSAWAVLAPCGRAQVIPAARNFNTDWHQAGYVGEIPAPDLIVNVKDYGAYGNGVNNDTVAINTAITNVEARGGGVVFFPAGTYVITNNAVKLRSNVVLRGERSHNTTILVTTNLVTWQTPGIAVYGLAPTTAFMDIASGYDLQSKTVSISNVTSIAPGNWVEVREGTNAAWQVAGSDSAGLGQYLQVTNVTVTNSPAGTVSFSTSLHLQYEAGLPFAGVPINPQIRKVDRAITNAGVENLRVARITTGLTPGSSTQDQVPSIGFKYALNCWVRGCDMTNVLGSGVFGFYSANCEVSGCYIHHAFEFDGGGSGYGVVFFYRTTACLVENCIFQTLRHSMVLQYGAGGNVFGYNFSTEPQGFLSDMTGHGNYTHANLLEGNCGAYMCLDNSHGANGPYNTYFRNRARGYMTQAIAITDTVGSNQTFVGNEGVGSYSIAKPGTFEYGNNDDGVIKPTGTTNLADYSYYLGTNVTSSPPVPDWWNISSFIPVYGPTGAPPIPPIGTERDIPARVRFNAGYPRTYGPPSLYRQPTNQVLPHGATAVFSVGATGTPFATYTWYKDGALLPDETNAVLSVNHARTAVTGRYWAVVADSCGAMRTAIAVLNVTSMEYIVTGNPAGYGAPTPYGYSTQVLTPNIAITNAVTNLVDGPPGTRYLCTGWSGGGSVPSAGASNSCTFVLAIDSALTWNWTNQYRIDLAGTNGGGYDRGSGWHNAATSLTVTALASNYFDFARWSGQTGGCSAAGNQLTVVMDQPRSIAAEFIAQLASNDVPKWWLAGHGLTNFNADAMADADHDGFCTWQEYFAGTDPTNRTSLLRFTSLDDRPSELVVRWKSASGRLYTLQRSTNLLSGTNGFLVVPGAEGLPGTGVENSYTDTVNGTGPFFYRVQAYP